jgi:hypothetical protein
MEKRFVFRFEGKAMAYELSDGYLMVNLTEMAKPYGRDPIDFLRLQQTKLYIEELEKLFCNTGTPIVSADESINSEVWGHQKLALLLGTWLSPEFYIWINERTKELIKYGTMKLFLSEFQDPDFIIRFFNEILKASCESKSK